VARARLQAVFALVALTACTAPGVLPPVAVQPLLIATLDQGTAPSPEASGPAASVRLTLRVAPGDGVPLRIVPCGPAESAGLLELRVSWDDWRGDGPVSYGRTEPRLLRWGAEGDASIEAPCVRSFEVPLAAAEGVLGRRIHIEGRLIGVDLVREDGHSGGCILTLPRTALESLAPVPPGLIEEHLQSGRADGIFLAAAGAPPAWREHVLDRLVGALPASRGPAREAIFAALLWLTGQTHGRDVQRWSTWWSEERARLPG
jgi:hypothetical protein